jgi:hypothetical protein
MIYDERIAACCWCCSTKEHLNFQTVETSTNEAATLLLEFQTDEYPFPRENARYTARPVVLTDPLECNDLQRNGCSMIRSHVRQQTNKQTSGETVCAVKTQYFSPPIVTELKKLHMHALKLYVGVVCAHDYRHTLSNCT